MMALWGQNLTDPAQEANGEDRHMPLGSGHTPCGPNINDQMFVCVGGGGASYLHATGNEAN